MLRTRALSALVLVPVLLVALWIGLPAIAAAPGPRGGARGRSRCSGCSRRPGIRRCRCSGRRSRSPSCSRPSRGRRATRACCSSPWGWSWRASAPSPGSIPATGWSPGSRRCSGPSTSGLIGFVLHVGIHRAGRPGRRAPGAGRRRARLDPAARAGRLELRHRRLPRRPPDRPPQVPDPHLAVQVDRGADRRARRHDRRDDAACSRASGQAAARRPRARAAPRARGAGAATSRSRCSSGRRAPRTRGR